jgi:hypothetical protein
MATTTKLTKAQLLARIDQLEAEVNALHVAQRPSRRLPAAGVQRPAQPVVRISTEQRRRLAPLFFAANPHARSATDAQLAAFA